MLILDESFLKNSPKTLSHFLYRFFVGALLRFMSFRNISPQLLFQTFPSDRTKTKIPQNTNVVRLHSKTVTYPVTAAPEIRQK